MADLGLAGAGRAMGAAGALRQMIMDRMAALQAAAAENDRQQQLAQTAKFQDAQITSMADERAANAALRKQNAAHTLTQDLVPGSVLDPTATGTLQAGNLGSLVEHQTPVLGSTSTTGATTLPSPSQPMQAALTSMSEAAHGAQDVYSGTPSQQRTVQTQNMLKGMLRSLPPNSPEAKSLSYRMVTGSNPPAGMLTTPAVGDGNYTLPGVGPIVAQKTRDGRITYRGQDVTDQVMPYRPPPTTDPNAARNDRSYQYHQNRLDKLSKPIEDAQLRMSRLMDSINQGTPTADALVAPELLTAMAGGQGSGLRMNEAEIARIVGGRSKWETLKATLNQWQTDPSKANSITPEQRNEMRALASSVNAKSQQALQILNDASDSLINASSEAEHRKIVADAKRKIQELTAGSSESSSAPGAGPKVGDVVSVRGQKIQITALHPDGSFDGNPVK